MRRDSLLDFFEDFAALSNPFLVYDDGYRSRSYTYAQVAGAARAFAERLRRAGLAPADKVLFWSENRPEWIAALWGCLLEGVVVVPVDYRASPDLLRRIHHLVGARLLLAGEEVPPPALDIPVWPLAGVEWLDADPRLQPVHQPLAEIIFTSGATSDPKGVTITHGNILANIVPVEGEVRKYRKYGRPFFPLRFLNLLPLSHMFGQAMATFIPPMLPGVVVFMRGYNPEEIVRQIRARRISVLVSVPKILEVLKEHVVRLVPEAASPMPGRPHWLGRWWRYRRVHRLLGWKFWAFIAGAAPLDPDLEEFWQRLGYVVIQGYGLTETAPIVTLNHPFHTRRGTVGKPIAGVEVRIAPDGEILVRGGNVTTGYYNQPFEAFQEGWFHTGDIGALDAEGCLTIRGRKKEMIVTPEGLNVFPEDVERVLNAVPGVRESAVVGESRVHAVLRLDPGADAGEVVRIANARLEDPQKVRGVSVWPGPELPRTPGAAKLKRREIERWVAEGTPAAEPAPGGDPVLAVLSRYARGRAVTSQTTLEELGLSSLERVELMLELEARLDAPIDESRFTARLTVADLRTAPAAAPESFEFPAWNRLLWARILRRVCLASCLLPLTRLFAWIRVEGRSHLEELTGPVLFASNHQSHLDAPVILAALPARWRYRLAPAMSKEFFHAHFHPRQHSWGERFTNSLNYYLAALLFQSFPLPQREGGVRQTLRYAADLAGAGCSILIFPEGRRTLSGEIAPFQAGVAMLASRLGLPVAPVRLEGLDQVLHQTWKMARPGRVRVKFGPPLHLEGDDYAALARQVEEAVRAL
ncbi:MAG: AMP-binding protein [Candidatus Solibacter usitatus]|nr:AMP-binding protein [Candidatus Solibacter usitatus]